MAKARKRSVAAECHKRFERFATDHNPQLDIGHLLHEMATHAQHIRDNTPLPPPPAAHPGATWIMPPQLADAVNLLELIRQAKAAIDAGNVRAACALVVQADRAYHATMLRAAEEPAQYGYDHLLHWRGHWLDAPPKVAAVLKVFTAADEATAAELIKAAELDTPTALRQLLSRVRKALPDGYELKAARKTGRYTLRNKAL